MCFIGAYSQTTYYSKSAGNLNTLATWGTNTNGSGTAPLNFTTAGCTYIIVNNAAPTISANWTVSGSGSAVQVGDGATAINFTIPSTFKLTGTINVLNKGTLTINNTTNPTMGTLSVGSTVVYGANAAQTIVNTTYDNLTLSGSGTKTLANTTSTIVNNVLTINSGVVFQLNTSAAVKITLNGTISGVGTITGGTRSVLNIGGSGSFGTLIPTGGTQTLNTLLINRASLGVITLGGSFTVPTIFTHTNGVLDLSGNTLSISGGTATFPVASTNGTITGSSSSNLSIAATTIANSLFMTSGSQTLKNLTLNSSGQTLTLGNDLIISGAYTQTKGIVNLNGKTLTLSGTATLASSAANGSTTGSSTSNLVVSTTAITNSLFMTVGSQTLNNLTLSGTSTLTLGTPLTVSGAYTQTTGTLSLGTQTLTLSGAVTFPASSGSGVIKGATASSALIINASSITNSLFMDQTTVGTSNAVKTFVLNSPSNTLKLGNNLATAATGIYTQTNGIVDLNGNTLTIGTGTMTLPASSANGTISGSSSSNLLISASVITNALVMTTGAQTLKNLTLNSSGQTLTLGSNLTVSGAYTQTKGIVNINGNTLTLSGTATLASSAANGSTTGSSTSNLVVSTTAITNSLFMTVGSQTLNNLTLSGTSILTLGTPLTVSGAYTQTSGTLSLGTQTLTLSGAITFPASASNGVIKGSATCALAINATSITNSLFMDQTTVGTSNAVKTLTLNSAAQTLSLGNNLVVVTGGTYTHTNGIVNLNGQTLTLNGSITFATPIANGSYTGSSTSVISIGGATAGTITNSLLMTQTSSSTNSLSNLTFNRNTKTLTLGNALNVIDSICPTLGTLAGGGNITLVADLVTVGHVGRIGRVGGSITGNITSQIYHNPPTGNTTNWMLMGAAGVTNEHFSDWANAFLITCPTGCASDGSAQNGGTPFASVTTYVENTDLFPAITGTASVITPGVGYWVFMGNSYYGTNSSPELITVTGTPKTGNFTWPTLTSTGSGADKGYNLLSNPYPSPISWNKVVARNSALVSANPNLASLNIYSATYNGGDYLTYNASSGISVPSYVAGTNSINDVIPAGGGFYVITTAASITTLSVTEADKVSGNNQNFLYRENGHPNTQTNTTPYISLVVSGTGNTASEAAIAFSANATTGVDAYDSPALAWNGVLQVTTISQGKAYAINALPLLTQNYSIPVKILSGTTTQYTISAMHLQNIAGGACLNLHDNYTNTDYDLRQGNITLTVNDTETVARFVLNITIDPTLSVSGSSLNPTCSSVANGRMIATASGAAPWNYYWKDGSNNIIKTSLNKTTSDTLYNANAGNYSVDINTVGSCNNGTVAYTLQGSQSASALFTPSSYTVTMVNDTAVVLFTNNSTNADTYTWDFGDGSQSNTANPSYQYTSAGDYSVTLTASSQACGDLSVYTQVITVDSVSYTTGIKSAGTSIEKDMQINRDGVGYYVQFNYSVKTNATISVQNLLGEKVVADIKQENISNNKTYIPLGNTENNLLIISVTTSSGEKTFRKVINY